MRQQHEMSVGITLLPLQVQAQESDSYSDSFAVCSLRQESVLPVSERQQTFMWSPLTNTLLFGTFASHHVTP